MSSYFDLEILRTGFNLNGKVAIINNRKLKIPKFLIGETVKFLKVLGSQANIEYKNSKHYIPLDTILPYKEYTVIGIPKLDDTCFVVHSKNEYYKIGTVLRVSLIKVGSKLAFYDTTNKKIFIDSSWLYSLKTLATENKLKELALKYKAAEEQVKSVTKLLPLPSLPISTNKVEPVVQSMLPQIKLEKTLLTYVSEDVKPFSDYESKVNELLSNKDDVYTDIKGYQHKSLLACLTKNQYYLDLIYLESVVIISKSLIKE